MYPVYKRQTTPTLDGRLSFPADDTNMPRRLRTQEAFAEPPRNECRYARRVGDVWEYGIVKKQGNGVNVHEPKGTADTMEKALEINQMEQLCSGKHSEPSSARPSRYSVPSLPSELQP